MTLVDTHCHLDLAQFDGDRDDVIARAIDVGVEKIIVPAIDLESIQRILTLVDSTPILYAAVGVHPNNIPADQSLEDVHSALITWAKHPKVIAIGEIGLDYYWRKASELIQHEWLQMQLEIAAQLGRPAIIHSRGSTPDLLKLLRTWTQRFSPAARSGLGVIHSFSGTPDEAAEAVEMGFYLGFTGPLTFKNSGVMREVVSSAPTNRILVETDAPFLAPHPHRGHRNESAYIIHVAAAVGEVRRLDYAAVCAITSENAHRLFSFQ